MLNFKRAICICILLLLALSLFVLPDLVLSKNADKKQNSDKTLDDIFEKISDINETITVIRKKISDGKFDINNNLHIRASSLVGPAWDFQDHTVDHSILTTLSDNEIVDQLTSMNDIFEAHGLPEPLHLAYPWGYYDDDVVNIVSQYRLSGRTASYGYPPNNPDWYRLPVVSIVRGSELSVIIDEIDRAVQLKGLMGIFTHYVAPDGDCTPEMLEAILDYLVDQQNAGNLQVMTMSQARSQFDGQKAVVVFSFDDAWATDYTTVWPMFMERGLAGTSYIFADAVNYDEPDSPFLNWDMIAEMAQGNQPLGWSITINSNPAQGGTTNPSGTIYGITGSLTVEATQASGFVFNHWVFDGYTLTDNPLLLPAQEDGTSHTLVAVFSKTLSATVSTDRARYTKWSYVNINTTVYDGTNEGVVEGASVGATVYDTHGRLVWSGQGITDAAGKAKFIYKLVFDAQMGTYTIRITAEKNTYQPTATQTTFYSLG